MLYFSLGPLVHQILASLVILKLFQEMDFSVFFPALFVNRFSETRL